MEDLLASIIKFDGTRNQDVVQWLQYTEEVFDRLQFQTSHKYIIIEFFLTDDAAIWFKHTRLNIPNWFTFKRELIEFFPSRRRDRHQSTINEEPQKLEQEQDVLQVPTSYSTMSHKALDHSTACINHCISEVMPNSTWLQGTESWHIHEIKPQRELFIKQAREENLLIHERSIETEPDVFRPKSTESWHFHDIKPQRKASLCSLTDTEALAMKQNDLVTTEQPYIFEEVLVSKPQIDPTFISETTVHSPASLNSNIQEHKLRQKLDTGVICHALSTSKCKLRSITSHRLHGSFSSAKLYNVSSNQSSRLFNYDHTILSFIFFSFFGFEILHYPALVYGLIMHAKSFWAKNSKEYKLYSSPYVITIVLLRELESLLVYGIT